MCSLAPCSGCLLKDVLVLLCVYFILSFGEGYSRKELGGFGKTVNRFIRHS